MRKVFVLITFLFLISIPVFAQEEAPVPQRVEVTAPDGLTLVGDFYAVPDADTPLPAVILLHGSTSSRAEWSIFITPLVERGYHVLNIDQRAHGETKGDRDLVAMTDDIQVWLGWLREQSTVRDDAISMIGSSMGTVPALAGCALDAECVTTILLSPGDFPTLDEAMFERLSERSVLIVVGRSDAVFYDAKKLFDRAAGEVAFFVYDTGAHATGLLSDRSLYKERVTNLILTWLDEHQIADS